MRAAREAGLRDADLRQARDVMDVVLRPSEFDGHHAWRRAVLDAVKALTGADGGGFLVNTASGHDWVSDYPPLRVVDYGIRFEAMVPSVDLWARHVALGVHRRDEVWLPIRPDFYETAYYRDYLRPMRALDSLGTTWYRGAGRSAGAVCQLLMHHESERGRRFGAREKALLQLLGPALRAGTEQAFAARENTPQAPDTPGAAPAPSDGGGRRTEQAMGLGLTPRQAEVAILLAQGKSNKAIARLLDIRPKTARRHTEDILRRLGIARRGEVAPLLAAAGVSIEG